MGCNPWAHMPSGILPSLALPSLSFTQSLFSSPFFHPWFLPFSHFCHHSLTIITAPIEPACPPLLPSLTFYAAVWQLRIISRLLSTTSCLLSATPLPISLHRRHLPFFRLVFLPGSLSLFIMSLSSFSSSLSYIIQASASHSEIKARACVPSKLQTRYLLEGQTGLCPPGFKEAEMHSMTADVGTLQSNLCASTLHHFSFIFTLLVFFAQVMMRGETLLGVRSWACKKWAQTFTEAQLIPSSQSTGHKYSIYI